MEVEIHSSTQTRKPQQVGNVLYEVYSIKRRFEFFYQTKGFVLKCFMGNYGNKYLSFIEALL